jgi:nucleoside-diphosphate-sugar epimerase
MKVFVTGASGFIGSAVVKRLIDAGHQVIGLARTEEASKKIQSAGAEVLMGDLESLDILKQGASLADGIIHTAFIHDFTQYAKANEVEKAAINAMGEALIGTSKPIVVAAGILGLPAIKGIITEESAAQGSPRSSEATAMKWAQNGVYASVVRLPPSVHGKGDKGFVPFMVQQARSNGISAYPGDGTNRWPAVHRLDAATVFQLAVEKSDRGALYNAVGDNGIALKEIAGLIGEELRLPAGSVSGDEMTRHFEWMSGFIGLDCPATGYKTQEQLGWIPVQMGLLEDLQKNYF